MLLLSILFFSSLNGINALGIVPGERAFVYDGKDIEYNIRVLNDELKSATYNLEINGELAKYVTLSKNKLYFTSQKADEVISAKLSIPETDEIPPGEYTIRISVKSDESTSSGVTAYVGVISKLIITIPGNDAYVKIQTFVPNFIKGEQNSFSVDIINKGIKPANNCFAVIDILSSTNSKVISLVSNRINVQGTRIEKFLLPWTPTVNNGLYTAKTSVICDETSAEDQKSFSIGSPHIKVVNFVSTEFVLGQINRFDLIIESEWGENIDTVYADIELAKEGVPLTRAKTESTGIRALEKMSLPVYLDTKNMVPGKYSLYVMLHYLDKDVGEIYDVEMSENKFVIDKLSGMVVGGNAPDDDSSGGTNALLVLAIIVIVVVNVVLVLKLVKRKKE
jgi:hypothetical protein